jgi:predicted nucleotidyltransferase
LDRGELLARLRAIAHRICANHQEVIQVRVFGSVARGDQTGTSDTDILIVLHGCEPGDPLEQIRLFYPYFDLPIGTDLLVLTESQIADRLQADDVFMTQIWNESQSLS